MTPKRKFAQLAHTGGGGHGQVDEGFFRKHTATPLAGPMEKAAIRAGSSEKSSLTKLGMTGRLKLRNISTVATAPQNGSHSQGSGVDALAARGVLNSALLHKNHPFRKILLAKDRRGGERAEKIPEPRAAPGTLFDEMRKTERRPAVPNLLSSGLCLDTPGVHRRCWNHTSSAEGCPSVRRLYCRSGIAPCPEDHLLVSF